MNAWMRITNWMTGAAALALLVFTGCSSSSGSRSGGCGGGCCGSRSAGQTPAVSPLASSAVTPVPTGNAVTSGEKPYGGQKTCPVMGEELGSMGPPIPVTVQGQTVYVCCQGCAGKVRRDPDKYIPKVLAERAATQ